MENQSSKNLSPLTLRYSYRFELNFTGSALTVRRGEPLNITGILLNDGDDLQVQRDPIGTLRIGVELMAAVSGSKVIAARCEIGDEVLRKGQKLPFEITLPTGHCIAGDFIVKLDLVYDGAFWLGKSGGSAKMLEATVNPSVSFDRVDIKIPLESVDFWRQHVLESNPTSEIGITTAAFQTYNIARQNGPMRARSMITEFELALLYSLTRNSYTGDGAVVDLGPLVGVGTAALARGLSQNPIKSLYKRIYSYDLFLMSNMGHFLSKEEDNGTGSCFETFMKINADFLDLIVPVPGDFLRMKWTGDPIEILFVDLAKSWDLNAHVVSNFFPFLIPGKSVVVQQDYVHAGEPWVALTMEYLSDYFEPLYFVYGASGVFRLKREIPQSVLRKNPRDLPLQEINMLFERARTNASPAIAEVLKCCQAIVCFEKGDKVGAANLIAQVNVEIRDGSDISQEFGPTIAGSLRAARKIVEG